MFKIEFKTSGAAFKPYDESEENSDFFNQSCGANEICRILDKIIDDLSDEPIKTYGSIIDINGNKVGEWKWE